MLHVGGKATSQSSQVEAEKERLRGGMNERESDYQDTGEDSLAEHLKAVPPVVGRLVVCGYTATAHAVSRTVS